VYGVNLVVLNQKICSSEQELTADLISIVHVFSCRYNGKRRYKKSIENGTGASKTIETWNVGCDSIGNEKATTTTKKRRIEEDEDVH
jgi:hypothetical protein